MTVCFVTQKLFWLTLLNFEFKRHIASCCASLVLVKIKPQERCFTKSFLVIKTFKVNKAVKVYWRILSWSSTCKINCENLKKTIQISFDCFYVILKYVSWFVKKIIGLIVQLIQLRLVCFFFRILEKAIVNLTFNGIINIFYIIFDKTIIYLIIRKFRCLYNCFSHKQI